MPYVCHHSVWYVRLIPDVDHSLSPQGDAKEITRYCQYCTCHASHYPRLAGGMLEDYVGIGEGSREDQR